MNKSEDYGGETINKPNDEQLSTVELSTDLKKFRATFIDIPVYHTRNNVYRGRIIDLNIVDTKIEPEQLQFQDFCMNVNTELNDSQFVFNWPNHTKFNNGTGALITIIVIIVLWYFFCLRFWNDIYYENVFDGLLYALLLYIASTLASEIISMVCDMPKAVGMMLVGISLKNSGIFSKPLKYFYDWFYLCELMESVILIIGGLEINIWKLRSTVFTVLKLAILPQITETVAVIVAVYYFWPQFVNAECFYLPWVFGLMNLPGINSVLFMPSLEKLEHLGYFDANNIYTLLNASSTLIDMAAAIFNYFFISFYYHGADLKDNIIHVATEILIDIVFGILWGLLIVFVASPNRCKQYNVKACRDDNDQEVEKQITSLLSTVTSVVLFFIGGILTALIKIQFDILYSFSLSSGISALVAGTFWRWRIRKLSISNIPTMTYNIGDEPQNQVNAVLKVYKYIWICLQPFFFGYIGGGFNIEYFSFWMLLYVPILLVFLLIIRILITTFSVWGSGFNRNQLLFINIACLPNATLMAGLLVNYLDFFNKNYFGVASIPGLLNFTIISSLMTTILGSYTVLYFGPKLLSTNVINESQR